MTKKLTLGIAKIGDLLINNHITQTSDGGVLENENITLKIPEYQRPYKWTAKNANQLLDDIEQAMYENKEVYRVGTLILHYDENNKSYNIVDGQQRIITFSLLLSCLENGKKINFLNEGLVNNSYNRHNVLNNYRTLKRRIDNLNDKKEELIDYVCKQCELIVVITNDLSEAFQFFDSQNARGKALYPHDLLKAYHLREMSGLDASETERIVKMWEDLNQKELSVLFNEYLYRLKEWVKGNRAYELNEHNIGIFKGVTSRDVYPYAQFYKGAFAYANDINKSNLMFVTGLQPLRPFQINAPIIAGKAFFEYAKHYFDILTDIRNNDKYEGYYINDNEIVRTLNLRKYKNGVGNGITRLLFDTAILLYVDRFCPARPSKADMELLNQFVIFAFIWAYSMRAQYKNVGWQVAQNYVMGTSQKDGVVNSFNIYKEIADSDSPGALLSRMADLIVPLTDEKIKADRDNLDSLEDEKTHENYLFFFKHHNFWEGK